MSSTWKGCAFNLIAYALPAKLAGGSVCFKCSEAIAPGWGWIGHGFCPVYPMTNSIENDSAKYNFPETLSLQSFAE